MSVFAGPVTADVLGAGGAPESIRGFAGKRLRSVQSVVLAKPSCEPSVAAIPSAEPRHALFATPCDERHVPCSDDNEQGHPVMKDS